MPIKDYQINAGLNTTISAINIGEGCPPGNVNDAIRQVMADIASENQQSITASATTVDLGALNGSVTVTGTTAITGWGTATGGLRRRVKFDDALTLTHHATSFILPSGANITTAGGDTAEFESLGVGNWRCLWYQRASGSALNDLYNSELVNPLINPDFSLWQRGTSTTLGAGGSGYIADRWRCYSAAGGTFSRQSDAPAGFAYSIDVNAGAGQIEQRIESVNARNFSGRTITVTVAAKKISGTAALNAKLSYANTTDNFSAQTQIADQQLTADLSSSWVELKTTFTNLPVNIVNGMSLALVPPTTMNYRIAWVKIEEGTGTAGFKPRAYGLELLLCQRYYEITRAGGVAFYSSANYLQRIPVIYRVQKRVSPSVAITQVAGGAWSPGVAEGANENGLLVGFGASIGAIIVVDVRADAEM